MQYPRTLAPYRLKANISLELAFLAEERLPSLRQDESMAAVAVNTRKPHFLLWHDEDTVHTLDATPSVHIPQLSPFTPTMQMRINIPPLTRVLLALLIAISVTHQITRYIFKGLDQGFLAIVPQWSLFYPWVYITATFAEQNVLTLLVAGATILFGGKYLERAWSSTDFAKFVLIVTVLPNAAATIIYVLWFALTQDESRA